MNAHAYLITPAFFFSVYDDVPLCMRLVEDLRSLYPTSEIVSVRDGKIEQRHEWEDFCKEQNVVYVKTHIRLKPIQNGGLWLHRLCEHALRNTTSDLLIKTEGDTRFHRPFRHYPNTDIAGTLNHNRSFPRGGCALLRRPALQKLIHTGAFLEPKYSASEYAYQRYGKWKYQAERPNTEMILCADRVLGDAIARLGLSLSDWSEVDIQFRAEPGTGFAATHPHRD